VVLWILQQPRFGGVYNMGTGRARSFLDLAHAVFAALGAEPRLAWVDTPEAIRDRYQYFTEASMERLRAAGYTAPFRSLEEGVADYLDWLRRNA
jgi:ADP-L-glycero-D-manno-heptose 6-epimerase